MPRARAATAAKAAAQVRFAQGKAAAQPMANRGIVGPKLSAPAIKSAAMSKRRAAGR